MWPLDPSLAWSLSRLTFSPPILLWLCWLSLCPHTGHTLCTTQPLCVYTLPQHISPRGCLYLPLVQISAWARPQLVRPRCIPGRFPSTASWQGWPMWAVFPRRQCQVTCSWVWPVWNSGGKQTWTREARYSSSSPPWTTCLAATVSLPWLCASPGQVQRASSFRLMFQPLASKCHFLPCPSA